ncbi:MAG: hypothetical protein ACI84K_000969 [Pseudohongiellaceae bacterium]|jgi:hypothetical protein
MPALNTLRFDLMSTIKTIIVTVSLCLVLAACSSTTSDVRQIIDTVDRSSIQGVQLMIGGEGIQLTSQTSSSIFTLHQNAEEVRRLAGLVAQRYGFTVLEENGRSALEGAVPENTGFYMNILSAMPDGGECLEGLAAAAKNLSYTGSVLTFGVAPASAEHCLVVKAELYQYLDNQRVLVGEFSSNLGRVEVYAGANEIDNYQLNADKRDEVRSLEVSFGGLLNTMLIEDAFVQKRQETFSF